MTKSIQLTHQNSSVKPKGVAGAFYLIYLALMVYCHCFHNTMPSLTKTWEIHTWWLLCKGKTTWKYWKTDPLAATNLISKTPPVEISISHTQIRALLQWHLAIPAYICAPHEEHTENAVEDYYCKVMKKDRPRYGNSDNQWVVGAGITEELSLIWDGFGIRGIL